MKIAKCKDSLRGKSCTASLGPPSTSARTACWQWKSKANPLTSGPAKANGSHSGDPPQGIPGRSSNLSTYHWHVLKLQDGHFACLSDDLVEVFACPKVEATLRVAKHCYQDIPITIKDQPAENLFIDID